MQLASKFLLDKIVICHCTENHIFFFRTSWKDSLPKKIALEYDLSCIIKKDDISFFPKIWSYRLDGKWKMIFLKKCTEIWYFLQTFWKYVFPKSAVPAHDLSCIIWKDGIFLPKTWSFFPGQKMKDGRSQEIHGNMTHHPAKKNRKPDISGRSLASP